MARKVFISFLGASAYKEANYYYGAAKEEGTVSKYIQSALIDKFCLDFGPQDRLFFVLTPTAKVKNWTDGLEEELKQRADYQEDKYQVIDINDDVVEGADTSSIERGIWHIFEQIYGALEAQDEVIFDITHSFRYLPMLAMTLFNYAKTLKNIKIRGVYYGAFEVLGPAFKIDEKYPNVQDRLAPIIDLTQLVELQDWTSAANTFIRYGKTQALKEAVKDYLVPGIQSGDHEALNIKKVIEALDEVTQELGLNRGTNLVEAKNIRAVDERLAQIQAHGLAPIKPIFERAVEKLANFSRQAHWVNGLHAVAWYLEHDQIQQGFTLLQETIITFFAEKIQGLDYKDREDREWLGSILGCYKKDGLPDTWNNKQPQKEQELQALLDLIKVQDPALLDAYASCTAFRNDINHAGFSSNTKISRFQANLSEAFERVKQCLLPQI